MPGSPALASGLLGRTPPLQGWAGHCHRPGSWRGSSTDASFTGRQGIRKKAGSSWLSGKSNKGLSTAVRMTQGNLPGSINSTLLSVPKPKSWHVKTLLSIPALAQISVEAGPARCWAPLSRSLETLLSWQQNTWKSIICSQWSSNWTAVSIVPISLPFCCVCTPYRYISYGVCPSEVPCHLLKEKDSPETAQTDFSQVKSSSSIYSI